MGEFRNYAVIPRRCREFSRRHSMTFAGEKKLWSARGCLRQLCGASFLVRAHSHAIGTCTLCNDPFFVFWASKDGTLWCGERACITTEWWSKNLQKVFSWFILVVQGQKRDEKAAGPILILNFIGAGCYIRRSSRGDYIVYKSGQKNVRHLLAYLRYAVQ